MEIASLSTTVHSLEDQTRGTAIYDHMVSVSLQV